MNNCLVCVDVYAVQAGDTLYSIARRYNVSVGLLMKANLIDDPYDLRVGLKLCIPGFADELPAEPGEGPVTSPTPSVPVQPSLPEMPEYPQKPQKPPHHPDKPAKPDPNAPTCKGTLHTVEAGDTLYMIAKKYRVNLNAIIDMNPNVDPYNLMIGTQLCIPR